VLPERVESFCRLIVHSYGLRFGAIDLIVTPDKDYVFLELNPNGQWAWIEQRTGLPLASALVDELTS
jgi:glutathione synthase/RimK-type ligase-like ATP-grasp enzyme